MDELRDAGVPSGFKPDRYVKNKKAFGRGPDPGWKPAQPHQEDQLALAQIQHRLALRLRETLGDAVVDRLAEQTAQDAHYVTRKLNGQIPLTALDLIAWTKTVGVDPQTLLAEDYGATDSSSGE